jgi:protein SCO1
MNKKFFWVVTSILMVVIIAAAAATIVLKMKPSYSGSVIDPPMQASDFSLSDQNGKTVRLSDFRGKYVLLYFGYTHCTTECPASMAILAKALTLLGTDADNVQIILIATDPPRDTPQAMGEFVGRFDSSFIGATGSQAALEQVWADYGVTVLDGGETHSSYIYLIDPQGNLVMTYPYPSTPEGIAADLRLLFKKG